MHFLLDSIELLPVNLLQVIFTFVAALGAVLIWNLKRFRALAFYFLFNAVLMLFNLLEEMQVTSPFYLLTPALTLVTGPLVYFFIRGAVNHKSLPSSVIALHFLPMALALPFTAHVQFVIALGTVSQLLYLSACFHLLYRYHTASMAMRSDADSLTLNWLLKVLLIYTFVIINDVIRLNLQTAVPAPIKAAWYFTTVATIFLIVCYLLIRVLRQPKLFDGMNEYEQSLNQAPKVAEHAIAEQMFVSLEQTIIKQELYRKTRLSVNDISSITGLSVKDISWAINSVRQQNFCEFINGLRVKDVQQQILSGAANAKSLLDIAFDCGFNSKSTFNAAFKKVVNLTPSQFLRQRKEN